MGDVDGKRVLFAGCGDALECLPFVKMGAVVSGVDVSESQIMLARKNCPIGAFSVQDFEKTSFKNNSFDFIVSILAIMYKKDLKKTFKEFRRILKKGGHILLVVPHPLRKMLKYRLSTYFTRGFHWEHWRGTRRFNYYRLFEDYVNAFAESNLKLERLFEPKPVKEKPDTPAKETNHPHFAVFKLSLSKN